MIRTLKRFACGTICIIGGRHSRKLPMSVKGVTSFTCPIINIETIGVKGNILFKYFLRKGHIFPVMLKSKFYYLYHDIIFYSNASFLRGSMASERRLVFI